MDKATENARRAALMAAEGLVMAATEMIRFGRNGTLSASFPLGFDDPTAATAAALHTMLAIELPALDPADDTEELDSGRQLQAALFKWLQDAGLDPHSGFDGEGQGDAR